MFSSDRDRREAVVLGAVCVVVIAMFVAVVLLDTGDQGEPDPIVSRNDDRAEVAPTSTSTAPGSTAGPEATTTPPPESTATTAAPSGSPTTRRGTASTASTAPPAPPAPPDQGNPGTPTDTVAPDDTIPSGPSFGDPVVVPRTGPPTTTPATLPTPTTTATTLPPPP